MWFRQYWRSTHRFLPVMFSVDYENVNWNWSRGIAQRPKTKLPNKTTPFSCFWRTSSLEYINPDRWMLLDKPFNSQVSEKVFWVPQLTRLWRVNNFLMIKKKSPHRLYIKIINIKFFLIQWQQEHQTDLFICKCDPVERIVYHWFRHDLFFLIITINILKIDNGGFGLYLSLTGR